MKKESYWIPFLWMVIAIVIAAGAFLIAEHFDAAAGNPVPGSSASTTVAMRTFSGDGYTFSVPASWNIEQTASDTVAVHPDTASPDAACKIEVSAFPYAPGTDMADWIARRIGADPSLAVAERSSEEVSLSGGTGVRWVGTIDGVPTTLVYAFGAARAYEIAPSVIGEGAEGNAPCDDMLKTFLSTLNL